MSAIYLNSGLRIKDHDANTTDGSYRTFRGICFIGAISYYWGDDGASPNYNCAHARKWHKTNFEYERPYSNISKCNNK